MKIVKKTISTIITALLVLILVINIYNVINIKLLKNDLTIINGYAVLEVVSGSMEPTIKIGDLVVINTKVHDYKDNDIVTFYDTNGAFVTHRIVSIDGDKMITKGDNNNTVDEEMPTENIVGKYVFKIGVIGNLLSSLKNPIISIMIFVIGILICYLISFKDNEEIIPDEEKKTYKEFLKYKEKEDKKEKINFKKKINNIKKNIIKKYKSLKKIINKKVKDFKKKINKKKR